MNRIVNYFSFYPLSHQEKQLTKSGSLAARDKVDYISSLFNDSGINVKIMSLCPQIGSMFNLSKKIDISKNKSVCLVPCFSNETKFGRFLTIFFYDLILAIYTLFVVKKGSSVVFYHCDFKFPLLFRALMALDTKIVLQVEEVYSDLPVARFYKSRNEEMLFFSKFSNFIVCSSVLKDFLPPNANVVIIEGPIIPAKVINEPRVLSDNVVNLVYAGTLSFDKGGADIAVEVMDYLPENYRLKIYGVGSADDTSRLKHMIDCKKRSEYIELLEPIPLQELEKKLKYYDLGLATQRMTGAYIESSFPSKIYLYLNNGLKVICPGIRSLRESEVSKFLSFYDNENYEEISLKIIQSISEKTESNYLNICSLLKIKQAENVINMLF